MAKANKISLFKFEPLLILLFVLCLISCTSEKKKEDDIRDKVFSLALKRQYNDAYSLILEKYKNNEEKLHLWFAVVRELEGKGYRDSLVIQKGWKFSVDENYTYIRGRVKNIGGKKITYFKIKALYQNKINEVVDMDYTNSAENLMPNMAKGFEIMHRNSPDFESASILVEEVSVE